MLLGLIHVRYLLGTLVVKIYSDHLELLAVQLKLFLLLTEVPLLFFGQKQVVVLEEAILLLIVIFLILVRLEDIHFCSRGLIVWVGLLITRLHDRSLTHLFSDFVLLAYDLVLMCIWQHHETVSALVVKLDGTVGRLEGIEVRV